MNQTYIGTDNQQQSIAPSHCERTRIKFCGLTRPGDVAYAIACGVDAVGFVLYPPSPRAVTIEKAASLASALPPFITPVLLFVNASAAEVSYALTLLPHAMLQFHGDETPEECQHLSQGKHPFIRAAHIPLQQKDVETSPCSFNLVEYANQFHFAKAILLDAKTQGYGGSGKTFNWSLLSTNVNAHLVLSGGLTPENVSDGIRQLRHCGLSLTVDVSSGIEKSLPDGSLLKGIKDKQKMLQFVHSVRQADQECLTSKL